MTFDAHRVWILNIIILEAIQNLSLVPAVYDTQVCQTVEIEYEPHRKKNFL